MEFIFIDNETGEEFGVVARTKKEAKAIAKRFFEEPVFQCTMPSWQVEMLGIDTY